MTGTSEATALSTAEAGAGAPGAPDHGRALLEVEDLHARYGPVPVLDGLDFHIGQGEVVVVLGANGAGKTTIMRAICGMVTTRGSVRLGGVQLVGRRPERIARLGVAHVPQGRGTFPELTVQENLEAGAYLRRDRRVVQGDMDRWCDMFAVLGQRRAQRAGELSGGEQQMLAVARALMSRPRLLLLDEPSLGLAPLIIRGLFEQLDRLNEEDGTTMLIVEQNASLALAIADRGYVIEAGRLVLSGSADELSGNDSVRKAYLGY
jgi:branched-chain amino acid transport system ATP-binding protein